MEALVVEEVKKQAQCKETFQRKHSICGKLHVDSFLSGHDCKVTTREVRRLICVKMRWLKTVPN